MEQVPVKNSSAIMVYFLIVALDSISFGLMAPILAPLLASQDVFFAAHFSPFFRYCLYGLLVSLFHVGFMLGAPLLGMLSDKYGRKRVLFVSLILTLIACIAYGISFEFKSISVFIFARLLAGISASSQGVAQAGAANLSQQKNKPIVMSTIGIGMTSGLIIGPLVGSLWTYTASWVPMAVVIFLCCMNILLLWYFVNDNPVTHASTTNRVAFYKPEVKKLLWIFLIFELGWSLYFQSLPTWLSLHWQLENKSIGYSISIISTMLALCLYFGLRIGLKFTSRDNLIQIGFFGGAAALIFIALPISMYYFFLLSFPIVLTVAWIYPSIISLLSELIPAEEQGLLMGITDALLAFSFAFSGVFSSLLSYFNPKLPFLAASCIWITGAIFCLNYKRIALCNSVST